MTINTIDGPNGNLLTAKSLYEALRSNHDILILDVRNRDDFEAGHIFAPNIICVDPISIREG